MVSASVASRTGRQTGGCVPPIRSIACATLKKCQKDRRADMQSSLEKTSRTPAIEGIPFSGKDASATARPHRKTWKQRMLHLGKQASNLARGREKGQPHTENAPPREAECLPQMAGRRRQGEPWRDARYREDWEAP